MSVFALATLIAAGCAAEGGIEVEFNLPENAALSPAGADLSEITLVSFDGETTTTTTRRVGDRSTSLEIGRLDVGEGITLSAELRGANQRLLGYGRSPKPITIRADEVIRVPMMVRRPFVYVTGDTAISTYDASRDRQDDAYVGSISLTRSATVVVPTADGGDLAVLSIAGNSGELTLVSTSTHEPTGVPPIPLAGQARDATVSHDSRFLVVGHDGAGGGLSIVDLDSARAGNASVSVVPLGDVGAVAARRGDDASQPGRAFALINRATGPGCPTGGPNSMLAVIDLANPGADPVTLDLGTKIHDMAVSVDGRNIIIADSCRDEVKRINIADDAQSAQLAELSDASAVAIFGDRVWAIGTQPATPTSGARLELLSINVNGTDEQRQLLQRTEERAQTTDVFDEPGQYAEQRMDADLLWPMEIAVLPGGDHLALLTWASFHGAESGSFFGAPIIPEMDMATYEYTMLDAQTTAVVQRVRTWCELTWTDDPFNPPWLVDWSCSQTADQDLAQPQYKPRHLSVLYGTR